MAKLLFTILMLTTLTGCIQPWVKPYERDKLSDPVMAMDSHPTSTKYLNHVFEAREAGRGAEGGSGGGCGCN